jgi:protein-tyrosine-phosphatase
MRQFPSEAGRIHLLGEYVGLEPFEAEIEDPIGKSEEFYAHCFLKIKNAIQKLGALL